MISRIACMLFFGVLLLTAGQMVAAADPTLDQQLLEAARRGDVETAAQLIGQGANIDAHDQTPGSRSDTPLHHAARRDDVSFARLLLDHGTSPNIQGNTGYTPLHVAAGLGRVRVAAFLIERGADMSAIDNVIGTPLHAAVLQGQLAMTKLLIASGANLNARGHGKRNLVPLQMVDVANTLRPAHRQIAEALIASGAEIYVPEQGTVGPFFSLLKFPGLATEYASTRKLDFSQPAKNPAFFSMVTGEALELLRSAVRDGLRLDARGDGGRSFLYMAASRGATDAIRFALAQGMDANETMADGSTPLMAAASFNQDAAIDVLIAAGARLDAVNARGISAFQAALPASRGMIALVRHGADVNQRNAQGETVLMRVRSSPRQLRALIAVGADVRARDSLGYSVLHRTDSAEAAKLLIDAGADVNAVAEDGTTPLFKSCDEKAEILVRSGADIRAHTNDGETPLHRAAANACARTIDILVRAGADVHARRRSGATPLHEVSKVSGVSGGCVQGLRRLLAHGAQINARMGDERTTLHLLAAVPKSSSGSCAAHQIKLLVAAGADTELVDARGKTARQHAVESGNDELAALLVVANR